jgi:hypothetical protein
VLRHDEILSTKGLNSVTFNDPYARLCFTSMIARASVPTLGEKNKAYKRVLYIDTDTTFTAYMTAGLVLKDTTNKESSSNYNDNKNNNNNSEDDNSVRNSIINAASRYKDQRLVQVFLPSEGRFESLLGDAIASMPEASIVIFDSLNGFYNMYPAPWYESESLEQPSNTKPLPRKSKMQETDELLWESGANRKKPSPNPLEEENTNIAIRPQRKPTSKDGVRWSKTKSPYTIGRLNHLLSIFIMLLVQHGIYYEIPVLVTSMVRYKKVSEDLWVKAPACRRLLNRKSVVRLSVEMLNDNDLSVNIMKHPSIEQQTVVYPNAGISLLSP